MSLRILQQDCGVSADGVFGPNTLKAAAKHYGLSKNRAVHFFAQTYHETGGFKRFEENLNYSEEGLMRVFPDYYPTKELARAEAYKPVAIANRVYRGRMGNSSFGNDGWNYRGRGAIQLTGKDNYSKYGYLDNPDIVATSESFNSAIKFFDSLWSICDQGLGQEVIKKLSKRINGGYIGLEERISLTNKFASWI